MNADLPLSAYVALALLLGLMLRGAWRGYRRGPLRQLAGPAALTAALAAAWFIGPRTGHAFLEGTGFPWLLRGAAGMCVVGTAVGLAAYSLCWWLGRRPEGAEEAESPVAGAFVGCWTGMAYFGLMLLGLFSWAAIEEALRGPREAASWSMTIRDELIASGLAAELKGWSPLPEKHRTLITRGRQVMASPVARRKLMNMPEIRALASHPSVYQAWSDKEVRKLMDENNLTDLVDHPKVRAALADEPLQKEMEKVDLSGLLGKALENPEK